VSRPSSTLLREVKPHPRHFRKLVVARMRRTPCLYQILTELVEHCAMEWHQGTVLGKHGAELRGLHRAPLYEFRDLLAVDPRPLAPGPARREPLQVVVLVELAHLAVVQP